MNQKIIITLIITILLSFNLLYVNSTTTTYNYAVRDSGWLQLDRYTPQVPRKEQPLIMFMYGGGFMHGSRNSEWCSAYCQELQNLGYTVAAIDYRLGMKGVAKVTPKVLEHAIQMGVEDVVSAINFLYPKAEKFNFDTTQIYLLGYSAGAILALQTDYYWANHHELTQTLPKHLRFAGVVSYSGAIYAHECKPKYKYHQPAPTLFIHGTADRIVTYKKIQVFNLGFFGSKILVKQFDKNKYPYFIRRYENLGHEVSSYYSQTIPLLNYFITLYGFEKRKLWIDETYKDIELQPNEMSKAGPRQLKKMMGEE